jgi:hypothetical protein
MKRRKPARKRLQVVDASFKAARNTGAFNNGLLPPVTLTKREQQLWHEFIVSIPWLEPADAPTALMWTRCWIRYVDDHNASIALTTRVSNLGTKLGMSPGARARFKLGAKRPSLKVLPPPSKASRFFDDGSGGPA